MLVDSGYRTDEVYQFAKSDERIKPVKGDSDNQTMPLKESGAGNRWGVTMYTLNTQLLKDRLAIFQADPLRWILNNKVDEVYLQHLAAEQKQIVNGVARWEPKSNGTPNHYLDCEVYQLAAAEIARCDLLQAPQVFNAVETPKPTQPTPPKSTPAIEIKELEFQKENTQRRTSYLGDTRQWLTR
jgi:phage terminase large subunit GpA-like protein